jgi:hypothetical protein
MNPPLPKLRDDEILLDEDTNIVHMRTRYDILAMKLNQKQKRLWDSNDEESSSEEDFAFLDNIAKGKANMTEMEAKLI